jgi:sugar/nucleoside kinase (ribokinase family)
VWKTAVGPAPARAKALAPAGRKGHKFGREIRAGNRAKEEQMAESPLDVVGIGNAIVDVLATTTDDFLSAEGLPKGAMTLVDEGRGEAIYAKMAAAVECSGGSAANTMGGFASFGGKGAYIGKVRDDQLGKVFRHDINALGVTFETKAARNGPSTARCLVLVTPDAQRTMATYLGACVELGPEDIDAGAIKRSQLVYLEGYLYDPPRAKAAFLEAAKIAHEAGGGVALTLSDPFCVERHKADFQDLVDHHVDVLFANEAELKALTGCSDFDHAVAEVRGKCAVAAITRSALGSVVLTDEGAVTVPAMPVGELVDTTGAGDLYAAGFLYGMTHELGPADCARLGGLAAAEIISHMGARPLVSLKELRRERLPDLPL